MSRLRMLEWCTCIDPVDNSQQLESTKGKTIGMLWTTDRLEYIEAKKHHRHTHTHTKNIKKIEESESAVLYVKCVC